MHEQPLQKVSPRLDHPSQTLDFTPDRMKNSLMFEFSLKIPSFEYQPNYCFQDRDFEFDSMKNLKVEEEKDYECKIRIPKIDNKRRR